MRHALCFQGNRSPPILPWLATLDHSNDRLNESPSEIRRCNVDLTIWVPAMLLLGLAAIALMFAFITACDKV